MEDSSTQNKEEDLGNVKLLGTFVIKIVEEVS